MYTAGCQTGLTTDICLHDTAGCQIGCTTGLTTGCIVYYTSSDIWQFSRFTAIMHAKFYLAQFSRTLELDNIDEWAKANNLTLSRSKSAEIVIIDRKRKCHHTQPSSLPDIRRVSTIKILGVTISNKLSVNDHVSNIVSKCSQTLYALTILRAHGLCTQLYKQSSGQSSSPGCYTPAAPRHRQSSVNNDSL